MHFVMAGTTAPSHTYPHLALIRELVARGHSVSYVVGARLASLVEPTGASVTTFGSIMPDSDTAWPEDPGAAMRIFLDDSITALPRLLELEPPAAAPRRASC